MLSKPLILIFVYIVTIFNIAVLLSPILGLVIPFIEFKNNTIIIEQNIYQKLHFAIVGMLFLISLLMLFYLVLDYLFGFSVRSVLKGCTRYEKIKDYDFLSAIFDQVKNKFGEKSVKLYVKDSDEINAFAISSVGSKSMVLTRGLIDHYLVLSSDPKSFLYSLRSIMGHEMSHLINKDFLPTFLIIVNQKVTNLISKFLRFIFAAIVRFLSLIPYGGRSIAHAMNNFYQVFNFVITSFNRFIVYNVYEFLRRFVSRSVEYRCDYQSARAFGGKSMASALASLGDDGYFTLFSTHPQTKLRVKKVQDVKISDSVIKPKIIDSLANYFSLMFLVITCLYFAKQAQIDLLVRRYIRNHEVIHRKLLMLWHLLLQSF